MCYLVTKLAVLIVIFLVYFASITEGSCWRYGHACWGGHGKRSGPPVALEPKEWTLRGTQRLNHPASVGTENDFLDLSRDPRINFRPVESNGIENEESMEKDRIYVIDYDQTEGLSEDQPIVEYESLVAKRNDAKLEYPSYRSNEETEQNSPTQFSSSDNPLRTNRKLMKLNWLRRKNFRNLV